jgi:hypothetical protein
MYNFCSWNCGQLQVVESHYIGMYFLFPIRTAGIVWSQLFRNSSKYVSYSLRHLKGQTIQKLSPLWGTEIQTISQEPTLNTRSYVYARKHEPTHFSNFKECSNRLEYYMESSSTLSQSHNKKRKYRAFLRKLHVYRKKRESLGKYITELEFTDCHGWADHRLRNFILKTILNN